MEYVRTVDVEVGQYYLVFSRSRVISTIDYLKVIEDHRPNEFKVESSLGITYRYDVDNAGVRIITEETDSEDAIAMSYTILLDDISREFFYEITEEEYLNNIIMELI